jgi:hypothetical protein
MPMLAALGSRLTPTVLIPISSNVMIKVLLRLSRSPMWPNGTESTGRKMKARASEASAARAPVAPPSWGKKTWPNTRAAAVPKMR